MKRRKMGTKNKKGGMQKMEFDLNYPDHKHPHGVRDVAPNANRLWACDECQHIFTDEEIRIDLASGHWAHDCKCHPRRKGQRCESHLESYMPEKGNDAAQE
uniref:Uncharacterized protein n=1 Tax=viral metagenome TaxID=1070528 RepID=A0A6M3K8V5_9ZZZZ